MADLKKLSEEMAKLKRQIEMVLYVSGYEEFDDLSGLDDFKQIRSADDMQMLEEYRKILYRLDDIQNSLKYYSCPIKEISSLHKNEDGRYETDSGYYYTSGSGIEFLRTVEIYNYNTETYEDSQIWTTSRIESKDGGYYVVGYPDIKLDNLQVRLRSDREYD